MINNLYLGCDIVNHSSVVSVHCADIRCPFCSKPFPGGRIEDHLLSCLTSPPLPYNSKYHRNGQDYCCFFFVKELKAPIVAFVCVCVCAQRTCSVRTVESVPSVWKIWYREKPSPGWLASVSTIRGTKFSLCICFIIN